MLILFPPGQVFGLSVFGPIKRRSGGPCAVHSRIQRDLANENEPSPSVLLNNTLEREDMIINDEGEEVKVKWKWSEAYGDLVWADHLRELVVVLDGHLTFRGGERCSIPKVQRLYVLLLHVLHCSFSRSSLLLVLVHTFLEFSTIYFLLTYEISIQQV